MKILYIFPHPDDESFGPASAIAKQMREGHQVYLLTLTKGEATKQRLKLGVDKAKMGEIRAQEMAAVKTVLGLTELTILDFPDSGLKELDPRQLEQAMLAQLEAIKPEVVVTYAVHGISGFEDHLVGHGVVKRAFVEARERGWCRRLALFTVSEAQAERGASIKLKASKTEDIDCAVTPTPADRAKFIEALDCYETYQEVIEASKIKEIADGSVHFEFFQEDFTPWIADLTTNLPKV